MTLIVLTAMICVYKWHEYGVEKNMVAELFAERISYPLQIGNYYMVRLIRLHTIDPDRF